MEPRHFVTALFFKTLTRSIATYRIYVYNRLTYGRVRQAPVGATAFRITSRSAAQVWQSTRPVRIWE